MGLLLQWLIECDKCGKPSREKAKTLDVIFDSDPVRVNQPIANGFETDGLGGWLCCDCFKKWCKEDKR